MYPGILAAHGVGMALVVGLNVAVSLRVLGVARMLPLPAMAQFYPMMWAGLWVNVATGVLLAMAGATRVLVDPVFFLKMAFVALAVANMRRLKRELLRDGGRPDGSELPGALGDSPNRSKRSISLMAVASIVLWGGAITLGRLMAYSFYRFWQ